MNPPNPLSARSPAPRELQQRVPVRAEERQPHRGRLSGQRERMAVAGGHAVPQLAVLRRIPHQRPLRPHRGTLRRGELGRTRSGDLKRICLVLTVWIHL